MPNAPASHNSSTLNGSQHFSRLPVIARELRVNQPQAPATKSNGPASSQLFLTILLNAFSMSAA